MRKLSELIEFNKLIFFILIFILTVNIVFCKDRTIEAIVGNEIIIDDTLSFASTEPVNTLSIGGMIVIQNQSMFYVDSIGYEVLNSSYKIEFNKRIKSYPSDSLRYVSGISLNDKKSNLIIRVIIYGEVLAGNDSLCSINISDREINDSLKDDLIVTLKVRNIGAPLPYVRFPFLSQGYPNPVSRHSQMSWDYWFDQDSDIIFYMFDLCGRQRVVKNLGFQLKGVYKLSFSPGYFITSGFYILLLETNSGTAIRSFFVME